MQYKYFTCGSQSEKEGLTIAVNVYDDDGNFVAGVENIEEVYYKVSEITKDQYDAYVAEIRTNGTGGLFGIVNNDGLQDKETFIEQNVPKPDDMAFVFTDDQTRVFSGFVNHLVTSNIINSSDTMDFMTALGISEDNANKILAALQGTP